MSSTLVRQMRRLLLSAVMLSVGLWSIPAQANVSDAQVSALVEALRQAAPQTGREDDGLYSDWQIKPENIPRWSKQCTGRELSPQDFAASPVTARSILVCVMRDVLNEQYSASGNNETLAVQRAAAWWMTGEPTRYNSSATKTYVQNVLNFYQQQRGNSQAQRSAPPQQQPAPKPAAQPTTRSSPPSPVLLSDAQVGALVEALRLAAPQTGTEDDGLYSDWQIKPENIPRWSKQCIGREISPQDFAASPVTARTILVCVMRGVLNEQYRASDRNESVAIQKAASWWMTGDPNRYNNAPTNTYTQQVLSFYQQQRNSPSQPAATQPSNSATKPPQPPTRSSSPSQISDAQIEALVEALRLAAPQTGTENDGLYSEWQVKPDNIPRWSKQCTGQELTPTQFQDSPEQARSILVCVMRDVFNEQYNASGKKESLAIQRAASWWMTGDPNQFNNGSTAAYSQKVLDFYQQSRLTLFPHI